MATIAAFPKTPVNTAEMNFDEDEDDREEDFLAATAPLVFGNIQARVDMSGNTLEIGFPLHKTRSWGACSMKESLPNRDAVVDVAFGPEDFGLWLAVALESEVRFYTGVDSLMAIPSKIGWHLASRITASSISRDASKGEQIKSMHWQPWGFVPAIVIGMDSGRVLVYAWDARIGSWSQTYGLSQENEAELICAKWAPCPGSVEMGAKHCIAALRGDSLDIFELMPPGVRALGQQAGDDADDCKPTQIFRDELEDRVDDSSQLQWDRFGTELAILDANNETIKTYVMNIQGEWSEK